MTVPICLRDQDIRDFMNTNRDLLSQTYLLDANVQLSFLLDKNYRKMVKKYANNGGVLQIKISHSYNPVKTQFTYPIIRGICYQLNGTILLRITVTVYIKSC